MRPIVPRCRAAKSLIVLLLLAGRCCFAELAYGAAPKTEELPGFKFHHHVSEQNPFVGQQILYRTEIESLDALELGPIEDIEVPGFLREDLGADAEETEREGEGLRISRVEVFFPTAPGSVEIPERELTVQLSSPRRRTGTPSAYPANLGQTATYGGSSLDSPLEVFQDSLLDDFGVDVEDRQLVAKAMIVNVRPLPERRSAGRAAPGTGNVPVGKLKGRYALNAKSIRMGESVTLTVNVEGDGNLRPFELASPSGEFSRDFKIYTEKPELEVRQTAAGVHYSKTFRLSFIPQRAGNLKLPPVEAVWFDPQKEEYIVYRVDGEVIAVAEEAGRMEPAIPDAPQVMPTVQTSAAPPAKPEQASTVSHPAQVEKSSDFPAWPFVVLLAGMLSTLGCLWLVRARRSAALAAEVAALSSLKERAAGASSLAELAGELSKLLAASLRDRRTTLTIHEAGELARNGVSDPELREDLLQYFSAVERALYGGRKNESELTASLLREGRGLATRIINLPATRRSFPG